MGVRARVKARVGVSVRVRVRVRVENNLMHCAEVEHANLIV